MLYSHDDLQAIWLTVKLAFVVTLCLLLISTPLAWWLARTDSKLRNFLHALVSMPLILPPSVLGFYLLLSYGPSGPIGFVTHSLGLGTLAFSFSGLVLASIIYSLPFVVQPIYNTMRALGDQPLEAAATLRSGPWDRFFYVVLPLSRSGFLTAAVLGFAHTVGEFGVVLMIGGNIPGQTHVIAVQIFDIVDALNYPKALVLSATMVIFSLFILSILYGFNKDAGKSLLGTNR